MPPIRTRIVSPSSSATARAARFVMRRTGRSIAWRIRSARACCPGACTVLLVLLFPFLPLALEPAEVLLPLPLRLCSLPLACCPGLLFLGTFPGLRLRCLIAPGASLQAVDEVGSHLEQVGVEPVEQVGGIPVHGLVDRVPGGLHGLAVRLPLQAGHSLLHSGRHLLGSHAHSSFGMHTRV